MSTPTGTPESKARGWTEGPGDLRARHYTDYEQYLAHQAEKLGRIRLTNYEKNFAPALGARLDALAPRMSLPRGSSVLCLGARTGVECRVFRDRGCFALGIDVNPGAENRHVVHGDFHALEQADASVDVVYTNALDHAFELDRVVAEIVRVLKPGGWFVAEIVLGSLDAGGREPGDYESIWWDRVETVARRIGDGGLTLLHTTPFEVPWGGRLHLFRKPNALPWWRRQLRAAGLGRPDAATR